MTQRADGSAATDAEADDVAGSRRLAEIYDVALLDLDGVVYVGSEPVPGAPEVLAAARTAGMRLAYVTNNASRRASEVADLLSGMGVPASVEDVVTSAQAAGRLLQERLAPGSAVLVVGTQALEEEVRSVGLTPVRTADPVPAAVVQGYGPAVCYSDLAEAGFAIQGGAWWVATNTDATAPSERGPVPGNGALVAAIRVATGIEPEVVGKPHPGLHRECLERTGARRPLIVGDRLDTDIEGAVAAGTDSMLVLSGVTTARALLGAPRGQRPTYIAQDVAGLLRAHPPAALAGHQASLGGFTARRDGLDIVLFGSGADALDALRAMCAASWAGSEPTRSARAGEAAAVAALQVLGLGG